MSASSDKVPTSVRIAAFAALLVSFIHVVFGAIVRITGSGMGCGEHWPKCHGQWFPSWDRPDLIIETSHRYLALLLLVAIVVFARVAWKSRHLPGVTGPGGVWPVAIGAAALWLAPAIFGAITVFLTNPAWATVVHKVLAAMLLAVLLIAVVRSGGLGGAASLAAGRMSRGSVRAMRAAAAAAVLSLIVIVLGGLTAKVPGAAVACQGFPLCGEGSLGGTAEHIQLTHRLLAYALVLHILMLTVAFHRRNEPQILNRYITGALLLALTQVALAAWMVLGGFPPLVRSLHQATGILIFMATFTLAYHARIAAGRSVLTHPMRDIAMSRDIAPADSAR